MDDIVEGVELLVDAGAQVNKKNSDGVSLLMLAMSGRAAEALIRGGADVNAEASDGFTALMRAASWKLGDGFTESYGRFDVALVLLEHHADVNAKDSHGKTALDYAVQGQNVAVAMLLKKAGATGEARVENANLKAQMLDACGHAQRQAVEFLLAAGAPISSDKYDGQTPLSMAVSARSRSVVELLLEKGANPNEGGNALTTPLATAIFAKDPELVKLLTAKGAKATAYTLTVALDNGSRDLARLMLEARDPSEDGTLLSLAVKSHRSDLVKLLLEAGMDPNRGSLEIPNSLVYAIGEGRDGDQRQYLMGAPLASQVRGLQQADYDAIVDVLLGAKVDVNGADDSGITPLMEAVRKRQPKLVELLLSRGAKVNARSNDGHTALFYCGDAEMSRLLKRAGAKK